MRYIFIAMIAIVSCPQASLADAIQPCDDLWYTRNAIRHRAGYCFGSKLGRTIFDNKHCIGKQVSLDQKAKRNLDNIHELEKRLDCSVDTNKARLDIPDLSIRRRLIDIPIPDEFSGGCIGWTGAKTELHVGHSPTSAVIGYIHPGDWVSLDHLPVGQWTYVTIEGPNWNGIKGGGWLEVIWAEQLPCREHVD